MAWALPLTINVDETYSLSRVDLVRTEKHLKGANADTCEAIYALLATKDLAPTMAKVKSHASIGQVLCLKNTTEMLALNELADVAAGIFADHQGDRKEELAANAEAEKQLELICHRVSHIQAGIWHNDNKPRVSASDVKACEEQKGLNRRGDSLDDTTRKIMMQDSIYGHHRVSTNDTGGQKCLPIGTTSSAATTTFFRRHTALPPGGRT